MVDLAKLRVSGLRWLLGEDFFISYSRGDGLPYAAALGNALAERGFSCFLDQWGSEPGRVIPPRILRSIERASMLVLVGSPAAVQSAAVEQEVRRFLERGQPLVPISFDGSLEDAAWFDAVAGAAISRESRATLSAGAPSPEVLGRVANSFAFTRRNQRVRRAFVASGLGLVALASAAGWATTEARREQAAAAVSDGLAKKEQARAEVLRGEAETQQRRAEAAAAQASSAAASAAEAEGRAREQQEIAEVRLRTARAAEWAGAARTLAPAEPGLAALLAVRAHREADTFDSRRGLLTVLAEQSLLQAQLASPGRSGWAGPKSSAVAIRGLWFDATGQRLAVQAEALRVFDLRRPWGPPVYPADTRSLHDVVPSPALDAAAGIDWNQNKVHIRRAGSEEIVLDAIGSILAWSPDGTRLAVGSEDGVRVWTLTGSAPAVSGLLGPAGDAEQRHGVTALDFSADGRTLHWQKRSGQRRAANLDGTQLSPLFPANMGSRWMSQGDAHLLLTPQGVLQLITEGSFGPGVAASGANASADGVRELFAAKERGNSIQAAAISAKGNVVAAAVRDGTLRIFVDGSHYASVRAHVRPPTAVAVSRDGRLVATGAEDGSVMLWHMRPGQFPEWASMPAGWRAGTWVLHMGLAWSPDGRKLWAAGADGVAVIDASSWHATIVIRCGDMVPASVVPLPAGGLLVGGRPQRVHVIDAADHCSSPMTIEQRNRWDNLSALAVSPDGKRALSGDDAGQIVLWDLVERRPQLPVGSPNSIQVSSRSALSGLIWRPDGFVMDGEVAMGTKAPPVSRAPWQAPGKSITVGEGTVIAGSGKTRFLAYAAGDKVTLVNAKGGQEVARWTLRPLPILGVERMALDPRERLLAAAHRQGVTLVDLRAGQPLGTLPLPLGCPSCSPLSLAFSPDGRWLAALFPGGVARWPVDVEAWASAACRTAARRPLSPEEAKTHGVPAGTLATCRPNASGE